MRSLVILLVGCSPLSVLTIWSFVELGSIDDRLGSPNPTRNVAAQTDLAAGLRTQAEKEKPLVDGLGEVDLLSGQWPAGLRSLPDESSFKPLTDHWPTWALAREMVAKFLQLERLTAWNVPEQLDQPPLEELDSAPQRLEDLKRKCEASKQKYEELKEEYQDSSARGTTEFLALVDRRIADLDGRIQHCQKRREAAALLSDARAALQPQQYGECVALCDKLLADYSSVLVQSEAAKVSILRDRARFRDDTERLSFQLTDAELVQREVLLDGFLNKYGDRASRTPAEQRILDQYERDLREVKAQLEAQGANRAAAESIQKLRQNLPPGFEMRLRSTVRIVDSYPTDTVKMTLRGNARQWLQEFLPEKQIDESPQLKEAQTAKYEIVRGFFADVVGPDGTLFGYKRYPTLQALNDPGFDVGTYRKEEFLDPPGESVPRQCVRQYNQARNRLIEGPVRRTAWVELADLCESLEAELRQYRTKKGASQEDGDLSFAQEGRFVRELLAGSAWADVETLFGP